MKKCLAVVALVAALAGCSAAPERIALAEVGRTLDVLAPSWVRYVEADAGLDEEAKADRIALWHETRALTREGLGDE